MTAQTFALPDLSSPWVWGGILVGGAVLTLVLMKGTREKVEPKQRLEVTGSTRHPSLGIHTSVPREERYVPDYGDRHINHDTAVHPAVSALKVDPIKHLKKQGYDIPTYSNKSINPVLMGKIRAAQDTAAEGMEPPAASVMN